MTSTKWAVAWGAIGLLLASEAQAGDCADRMKGLKARLDAVPNYVQLPTTSLSPSLPRTTGSKPPSAIGPAADVVGGRLEFQDQQMSLTELGALKEQLAAVRKVEEAFGSIDRKLYLRLDAKQKVQDALPAMCEMSAGYRVLDLVVDDPEHASTPYTPPPPPPVLRRFVSELAKVTSAVDRARILAGAFDKSMRTCEALRDGFGELANVPPNQRSLAMRSVIPDKITKCGCDKPDLPALEALAIRILAPTVPPSRVVELRLTCDKEAKGVLRLPKGATAQQLVDRLKKRRSNKPVRIEIR